MDLCRPPFGCRATLTFVGSDGRDLGPLFARDAARQRQQNLANLVQRHRLGQMPIEASGLRLATCFFVAVSGER